MQKKACFFVKASVYCRSVRYGSMVKRLRRRPLTAETRVRFPYGLLTDIYLIKYSPTRKHRIYAMFFIFRLLLTPDAPAAVKYTLHALTLRCQDTVRIMLFRLTLLDETVETRHPWRGSPWLAFHGKSFLCFIGIILQYLNSFTSHACKVYFTAAGASGVYPRYDK